MKEYLIFRFKGEEILQILNESEAHLLNDSDIYEGKIPVEDERFEILRRKWIKWYNRNSTFTISSNWIERTYSKEDFDNAKLFRIVPTKHLMVCGEECGTKYDYSKCCSECNSGRVMVDSLKIKKSRAPKTGDWIHTYGGEILVSRNFCTKSEEYGITGVTFKDTNVDYLYQPIIKETLEVSNNIVMNDLPLCPPLRKDFWNQLAKEYYRCPKCGTYLSTLQSEASVVNSSSIEKYDLFISRQLFGVSRGYLYYEPLYFCSQKFRRMVETEKLKGIKFEVAHIVDPTL